jgi:hypothetical protein
MTPQPLPAASLAEAKLSRSERDARRQTLNIPLPGRVQGFIEVINIEE